MAELFPQDLLQETDNVQFRVVNYTLYGFGKSIQGIYHMYSISLDLLRIELVPRKNGSIEMIHDSPVAVRTNDLIPDQILLS